MKNLPMVVRMLLFLSILALGAYGAKAQIDHVKVAEFSKRFSELHDFPLEEMTVIFNNAQYQQSIIDKMERPAEGMPWYRYRNIFMQEDRIEAGVEFWEEHAGTIKQVSEESGVAPEIIVGILGVETFFGRRLGSYRVLDALYTLAFGYPKRSKYFTSELENFLLLAKEEDLDIYAMKGSYAGAIGYCQFMPSSYLAYAKSLSGSASRNLMEPGDAIASVANYLKVHRWQSGDLIAQQVSESTNAKKVDAGSLKPDNTLRYYSDLGYIPSGNVSPSAKAALIELEQQDGPEYWFGFNNFYVITRYNHSPLYAMAVYQLGEAIKARRNRS